MQMSYFETLPASVRETANSALRAAFGQMQIAGVNPIKGGATTASTLRIDVGGRRYLLRIEGEPSPLRNPHQYVSMRIAAEAGIAPPIRFIDEAARVAVIDFIEQRPLNTFPGGRVALSQALGNLVRRVQSTPTFPYFIDYPEIVASLFRHVRRTGLFADGRLDPHFERLELLQKTYDAGLSRVVSSHNDFIPSNILFDGNRLWLIDWESAYRNDPFVDVSIALDSIIRSQDLEPIFCEAWLGKSLDDEALARLVTVRALTRLYYAGVLLSASAATSCTSGDVDLSAPTVAEFERMARNGHLKPGEPQTKHVLGKMFLASFMTGVEAPGFAAAV
ncbi:phosphotransferase [Bradyrhizobium sp. CIAT3101]|uniref:phosphotransferase n=1 Tax=Bradyrhizobium sp. CIAT3101 TaxID=439387 RepID=UPI0024B20856|nr:phosphotransferase [Bradyrhizobium sp. CIAT3101]WFU78329.1 phosphotransferase [Bradyrhizobium sp. CIAT3101]